MTGDARAFGPSHTTGCTPGLSSSASVRLAARGPSGPRIDPGHGAADRRTGDVDRDAALVLQHGGQRLFDAARGIGGGDRGAGGQRQRERGEHLAYRALADMGELHDVVPGRKPKRNNFVDARVSSSLRIAVPCVSFVSSVS